MIFVEGTCTNREALIQFKVHLLCLCAWVRASPAVGLFVFAFGVSPSHLTRLPLSFVPPLSSTLPLCLQ